MESGNPPTKNGIVKHGPIRVPCCASVIGMQSVSSLAAYGTRRCAERRGGEERRRGGEEEGEAVRNEPTALSALSASHHEEPTTSIQWKQQPACGSVGTVGSCEWLKRTTRRKQRGATATMVSCLEGREEKPASCCCESLSPFALVPA